MKYNLNISILDDNQLFLNILGALLDQADILEYRLFSDPQDFLNLANGHTYLAVIDHRLNNSTGLEVAKKLLRRSRDCFIIVVSGEGSEDIVAQYMNASCDRYLRKSDPKFPELFIQYVKEGIEKMTRFLSLKDGQGSN